MKRLLVICLSGLLAAACLSACTSEAKNSVTESSVNHTAQNSAASNDESSSKTETSHEIDSMTNGQKISLKDSEIYSVLNFQNIEANVVPVEHIIINEDCLYGKKGQAQKHYYHYANNEEGIVYMNGDTVTSEIYLDYKTKKNYLYNAEVEKYYTLDIDSETPEHIISSVLPLENIEFVIEDGCYIYTAESEQGTIVYQYSWDNKTNGIHFISNVNNEMAADIMIIPEYMNISDTESLSQSIFDFINTKDEVEAPEFPDFSDTSMQNYLEIFSEDFMNNYWNTAKVIKKAESSE